MAHAPEGALILIDIQQGFQDPRWGSRNNQDAELHAARLLEHWRKHELPIFHVRHASSWSTSPLRRDLPGFEFRPEVAPLPGESEIVKTVNSAFIGTNLEACLRREEISRLTMCGLTTPHCVSTTARMAANLGFKVVLVADACAAVSRNLQTSWSSAVPCGVEDDPELSHFYALSHLHGEFATVVTSQALLSSSK